MGKFLRKTREERENEILEAALKVFLQKGYRKTTMEDIINETTLSKGGFYHYFGSTKEIFFALLDKQSNAEIDFLTGIKISLTEQKDFVDKIATYITQRMFDKFKERELYLMGVCETFDDQDFLERLHKMEEKYMKNLTKYLLVSLNKTDTKKIEEKLIFLLKIFQAMVISCHLFKQEDIYQKNKAYIKNLFTQILADI